MRNPQCTKCPLFAEARTVCLWGHGGTPDKKHKGPWKYYLIGEAPGSEEDHDGIPFVGKTGRLLRNMLDQLGIQGQCYIDNAVRCRPPGNKTPTQKQIDACRPYLLESIQKVKPEIIVCLGATALRALLGNPKVTLGEWRRQRSYHHGEIPVIVTYHPAACFRVPEYLPLLAEDLERLVSPEFQNPEEVDWKAVESCPRMGPGQIAVDVETEGLNSFDPQKRILSLAVSWERDRAYVTRDVAGFVHAINARKKVTTLVGHNLKFDLHWLVRAGLDLERVEPWDTLVAAHLLDENRPSKSLKALALEMTGYGPYADEVMELRNSQRMADLSEAQLFRYNAYDAAATWRLYDQFRPELKREGLSLLFTALMEAELTLVRMEQAGIRVDAERLEIMRRDLQKQGTKYAASARHRIERLPFTWEASDLPINLGSNKRLTWLLYEVLCFRPVRRTKTGPGVAKKDLESLVPQAKDLAKELQIRESTLVGLIQDVLGWRKTSKLVKTYVAGKEIIPDQAGRIHPTFNLAVTVTGRLSCQRPNLQNIPRAASAPIKRVYVANRGQLLLSADYQQIELRLGAYITRDANMLQLLRAGVDLHTETARVILGREPTPEERTRAKAVNFGVFYGMGSHRLAAEQKMDLGSAQRFLRGWYRMYPGVRLWQKQQEEELLSRGFVTSIFGRKRRLPAVASTDVGEYRHMLRQACNFPIQGMAGELTLFAGSLVDEHLREFDLGRVILNVHDQIVAEVNQKDLDRAAQAMRDFMEDTTGVCEQFGFRIEVDVPTPVDVKAGPSWAELEPINT